ncbi:MAG: SPFH domain-containing protein [Phycisphaerales bacterium]
MPRVRTPRILLPTTHLAVAASTGDELPDRRTMTMGWISIILGGLLAIFILASIPKIPSKQLKSVAAAVALGLLFVGIALSSIRFVPASKRAVVIKNALGPRLESGQIIATNGEMGPQAEMLSPGWHFWFWPVVYDIEMVDLIEISEGEVGLLTAADGKPLPQGQAYADEFPPDAFDEMLNAQHFLTDGGGAKGPQASVLGPGKHVINPRLFRVERVPVTNIQKGSVAVIKSNVGDAPKDMQPVGAAAIVARGQRGIWKDPFRPQKLYLNTKAYEVTPISTMETIIEYSADQPEGGQREIEVRTSDGFTFPVDVRVKYEIRPEDAPLVVATLGDDGEKLRSNLTSAVRAIIRDNAESVKALDYVQQRSLQQKKSLEMLGEEMSKVGVTIKGVYIGNVGNEETLGALLKTQTDREVAIQEQITFVEQQKAAEKEKDLARTRQEKEEEMRLATAQYQVKIAEEDKQRRLIDAQAEAEVIQLKAEAQADAFRVIAEQIGPGNTALMELLKIIGEGGIEITPRVMVAGERSGAADPETTALIGTMLDSMMREAPPKE